MGLFSSWYLKPSFENYDSE